MGRNRFLLPECVADAHVVNDGGKRLARKSVPLRCHPTAYDSILDACHDLDLPHLSYTGGQTSALTALDSERLAGLRVRSLLEPRVAGRPRHYAD